VFSVPSQSAGGWAGRNAGEMTNLSVGSSPGWSPMQLANSTVPSRRRRSRWCELGFNRVALVSHLCLTGLPDVAVPYSDMWQDCQITFPHTRPSRAIGLSTPSDPTWKRPPGRPRTKWTDQLCRDQTRNWVTFCDPATQ